MTTIHAGIISPFNAVVNYQQWASALSYASTSPPATQVSKDGLDITYGTSTLHIPKWRSDLLQLYDELKATLAGLLHSQQHTFPSLIPVNDDWSIDTYGYSWMDEAKQHVPNE